MTIMRIVSRIILRNSSQSWSTRWFSTAPEAAAAPRLNKPNPLYKVVVERSSDATIPGALDQWVNEGNRVRKPHIFSLIHHFRNRNKFQAAAQLYDWIDSSTLKISNAEQAMRIHVLSKAEGVAAAEKYFNSLKVSEQTIKTYGALLSCYCREKVFDKGLEIFEKMKVLNHTSAVNYNNVLSLYAEMEQHEKVVSLVREMEEKNIAPDRHTYNLLINSYVALKDSDAIEGVLEKMKSSNIKPDLFMYGNLVTMFLNSGLHEKANVFLELIEQTEVQHDEGAVESYHTRLKLYSMMNNISGVYRTWEAIKSISPTLSNTSYLMMLLALSKLGERQNLEKIFKEWEEGCSVYDFRLPNVLLEYYLTHNMIEEATSLYKTMENRAEEPNLRALNLFVNLCIKNGQIDLALKYLEMGLDEAKPRKNKWFPKNETMELFVNYFEANNDTVRAEKLIQIMKKHGCEDFNPLLLKIKAPDAVS